MGQTGSQQVLETLERANVFLIPLDGERRCYRYHTLFAEALRARLEQTEERQVILDLHRRASDWYAAHGALKEAIEHALQAQDWSRALELMESAIQTLPVNHAQRVQRILELKLREFAIQMLPEGSKQSSSLLPWRSQVPTVLVRQHPRLCLFFALLLLLTARFQEAGSWLDVVDPGAGVEHYQQCEGNAAVSERSDLSDHRRKELLGELLAYRAQIASYYGESQAAHSLCQQALSYLSDQNTYERANVACALALTALAEGEVSSGIQHALETSRLMQVVGNMQAAVCYHSIAAFLLHRQGRLQAGWQMYQEAIALGTELENVPLTAVGLTYAYQADLLREWNRLDEALDFALRGLHLAEQWKYNAVYLGRGYQALIRIYLSRGELDAAQRALQKMLRLPLLMHNPYQQASLSSVEQVRLWIASGQGERASHWAAELARKERPPALFAATCQELALVRVHLFQAQPAEALRRLELLLEPAKAQQRWEQVLQSLLLQALAYQMNQQEQEALSTLTEAVRLAEPEGYIRSFVDEGDLMYTLLRKLRAQQQRYGPTPSLDTVLDAFTSSTPLKAERLPKDHHDTSSPHLAPRQPSPLLDPLSVREQEVLRLLANGASNQEIAEALVVTTATVKYHVTNILSKLQARNRTQAVIRARKLGLLPPES